LIDIILFNITNHILIIISPASKQIYFRIIDRNCCSCIPIQIGLSQLDPSITITIIPLHSITRITLLIFPTNHINMTINRTYWEIIFLLKHIGLPPKFTCLIIIQKYLFPYEIFRLLPSHQIYSSIFQHYGSTECRHFEIVFQSDLFDLILH